MHVREYVGKRAVVGLGPAVKWVLVALGAFQPHTQKCRGRALGQRLDRNVIATGKPPPVEVKARFGRIVGRGTVFDGNQPRGFLDDPGVGGGTVTARRRDDPARDFRIRSVVGEPLAKPFMPQFRPARSQVVRPFHCRDVAAGNVEEPGRPQSSVHRVRKQLVDFP